MHTNRISVIWVILCDFGLGQIKDYNRNFDKCEDELRVHGQQRMDDLELLEKAISTVQKQQTRLRGNVDESLQVKRVNVFM
jgi:hypothetical protein